MPYRMKTGARNPFSRILQRHASLATIQRITSAPSQGYSRTSVMDRSGLAGLPGQAEQVSARIPMVKASLWLPQEGEGMAVEDFLSSQSGAPDTQYRPKGPESAAKQDFPATIEAGTPLRVQRSAQSAQPAGPTPAVTAPQPERRHPSPAPYPAPMQPSAEAPFVQRATTSQPPVKPAQPTPSIQPAISGQTAGEKNYQLPGATTAPQAPQPAPTGPASTSGDDDPVWRRLSTIFRKHKEKEEAEQAVASGTPAAPSSQPQDTTPPAGDIQRKTEPGPGEQKPGAPVNLAQAGKPPPRRAEVTYIQRSPQPDQPQKAEPQADARPVAQSQEQPAPPAAPGIGSPPGAPIAPSTQGGEISQTEISAPAIASGSSFAGDKNIQTGEVETYPSGEQEGSITAGAPAGKPSTPTVQTHAAETVQRSPTGSIDASQVQTQISPGSARPDAGTTDSTKTTPGEAGRPGPVEIGPEPVPSQVVQRQADQGSGESRAESGLPATTESQPDESPQGSPVNRDQAPEQSEHEGESGAPQTRSEARLDSRSRTAEPAGIPPAEIQRSVAPSNEPSTDVSGDSDTILTSPLAIQDNREGPAREVLAVETARDQSPGSPAPAKTGSPTPGSRTRQASPNPEAASTNIQRMLAEDQAGAGQATEIMAPSEPASGSTATQPIESRVTQASTGGDTDIADAVPQARPAETGAQTEAGDSSGQSVPGMASGTTPVIQRSTPPGSEPSTSLSPAITASPEQVLPPTSGFTPDSQDTEPLQPLQAIWPVQRQAATQTEAEVETTGAVVAPPAPERDLDMGEKVRSALQNVISARPTDSKIELVPPRRPPPALVQAKPAERKQTDLPASLESEPIETEIGPLPSDLWTLIGQEPPQQSIQPQSAATAVTPEVKEFSAKLEKTAPTRRTGESPVQRQPAAPGELVSELPGEAGEDSDIAWEVQQAIAAAERPAAERPAAEKPGSEGSVVQRQATETTSSTTRHSVPLSPAAFTNLAESSPPDIQRVEEAGPSGGSVTTEEGEAEQGGEPDMDELARRVYAEVRRRLAVEWERLRQRF